jgi:hypothetical protein
VNEEACNGLLEVPPVEGDLHGEFGAEAQLEGTPDTADRDDGG